MNFDFERILFYATLITGVIALLDILFFAPKRKRMQKSSDTAKLPLLADYARSFFPVLLIVFILRSFLYEPFRIPSGSLEPTLLIGDFILLNKYDYGMRLPILRKKIVDVGQPKRGDVMVFRWPPNPAYYFIKRVIGLPGDHVSYVNKELTVNGQKVTQDMVGNGIGVDESGAEWPALIKQENLLGVQHNIQLDQTKSGRDFNDIVVPEGMYFVMGDNRDFSADSRYWGFVPDKNVVGKAVLIWLSWDGFKTKVRWDRIGKLIH